MRTNEITALTYATCTSLGTSTTKTLLNGGVNVTLPAWCKSLKAIIPNANLTTATATQGFISKLILESDDLAVVPYEIPMQPMTGGIAAAPTVHGKDEKWDIECPTAGGEEIKVYGQALVANTAAPYAGATIVVSNLAPAKPQRFAKMGTATQTGTAAAEVAGTAYSIHGSDRIIETTGMVTQTTVDASKPFMGYFRLQSTDFQVAVPLKYHYVSCPTALALAGQGVGIHRFPVSVPTNTTCTIQDYHNLEVAVTTTGYFLSGVRFEKAGR